VAELIAVTWLPRFTASVGERYPAVTLQFDVTMNPAMLEGLRSGSLDLALMIHTGSAIDLLARPRATLAPALLTLMEMAVEASSFTPSLTGQATGAGPR